ncbi:MAG: hypothetical protein KatS3mg057_0497 [Herpetosiphonaceae bacterium]|nr:MAG: hypothetical protein KatS3mg057_0497 [Herpetosiphonaceae bacterium]
MLETEPKIVETYVKTGKARLVYHHIVDFGERSLRAAQAAECAGEQGVFWEMHHLLYERQAELWSSDDLPATAQEFAAELNLDQKMFHSCMESGRYIEKIKADDEAAKAAGIFQRPSFDINGRRLIGAQSFAQFQRAIEAALTGE